MSRKTKWGPFFLLGGLGIWILIGCGKKTDDRNHQAQASVKPGEGASPEHGAEAVGASYQEGRGIVLVEETKKSLSLEIAEVGEQEVWPSVKFSAQIYRAASEASRTYGRERQGKAYATALVSPELVSQLKSGQKFNFHSKDGTESRQEGTVWRIDLTQKPVLGKAEVLLELPDPDGQLQVGALVEAEVPIGNAPQKLVSVPSSAVLQTSTGTYAFVQNGPFLLRTEIKTGVKNNDYVQVTEGLYEGDSVAIKPVETLYLIELRATKGGGHCH